MGQQNEEHEGSSYDNAFQILSNEIPQEVLKNMKVITMADLCKRYIEPVLYRNMHNPNYRREKKTMREFGGQKQFWFPCDRSQTEIINQ